MSQKFIKSKNNNLRSTAYGKYFAKAVYDKGFIEIVVGTVIIFLFLNYSKRNARQPGKLPDSCPKGESVS